MLKAVKAFPGSIAFHPGYIFYCHPERSEGSAVILNKQILRHAQNDTYPHDATAPWHKNISHKPCPVSPQKSVFIGIEK
jgi:hypothetical protein